MKEQFRIGMQTVHRDNKTDTHRRKYKMRKVKVAAVQMRCTRDVNMNIANAEKLVREAAADGAQIILLPELFERQYFCQERQYE